MLKLELSLAIFAIESLTHLYRIENFEILSNPMKKRNLEISLKSSDDFFYKNETVPASEK